MSEFGKGTLHPSEHSMSRDRATGAVVHQLTRHPSINHPTYFLNSSFTPDGAALLFTSYRSGSAQLFEVAGFPDGPIKQLTAASAIHPFSPVIHRDGRRVLFVRGGSIGLLDRVTLEEHLVVEFAGAQLGECSLSRDGEWVTAAARVADQPGLIAGRIDGSEWRMIGFPRTVIHPQFHPLEPEWIEFAADPAPRMHRVRRSGTGLECLYEHGNDEFVVHETFLGNTGDIVYTVWPRALRRMDWTARLHSTIAEFNCWHITPNRAGRQVLCDTNHPDRGLFLIDAANGAQRHLCLTEATNQGTQWRKSSYALAEDFAAARSESSSRQLSWMENATDSVYGPQWTHPHPSFSADEKLAAFASDRGGHTQVYAVELEPK